MDDLERSQATNTSMIMPIDSSQHVIREHTACRMVIIMQRTAATKPSIPLLNTGHFGKIET